MQALLEKFRRDVQALRRAFRRESGKQGCEACRSAGLHLARKLRDRRVAGRNCQQHPGSLRFPLHELQKGVEAED